MKSSGCSVLINAISPLAATTSCSNLARMEGVVDGPSAFVLRAQAGLGALGAGPDEIGASLHRLPLHGAAHFGSILPGLPQVAPCSLRVTELAQLLFFQFDEMERVFSE